MQSNDWQFPMACPTCGACAGTPYQASPEGDSIRVWLRCSACHHTWEITGQSSTPLMFPKPDRRHTAGGAGR